MVRKFFYSFLILTMFSFAPHKYYVSITDIELNKEAQVFEISIKFIGHDLENALEDKGVPQLFLGTEKEELWVDYCNQVKENSNNNKNYHKISI
mgnify:CR=1 FL=1